MIKNQLSKKIVNKVCYVLCYRCPDVIRTRTLLTALKKIESIDLLEAINTSTGLLRYIQTITSLLLIRIRRNPEMYILGFRGYEIFFIVRLITMGRILVFDHMMSPYDSLINERKKISKGGILDRIIFIFEKMVLRLSDIILTDTILHKLFLIQNFDIPSEKIVEIHIGTDEETFHPPSLSFSKDRGDFHVLFYGTFLPLHGVDIILMAANLLREKPIIFTMIGGKGKELTRFYNLIKQLNLDNIHHEKWVPYNILPQLINDADICLGGPFGNTGQARRVITSKTFQCLAMAKPTIIGKIDHDYGFKDKDNCLMVSQADYKELADKIAWCLENKDKLPVIGENGYRLYKDNFSVAHIKQIFQNKILC